MAGVGVCQVAGCDNDYRIRKGYCNRHYLRLKRHGDPLMGRTPDGDPLAYLQAHMWDDCPRWPFYRHANGYGEMTYGGRRGVRVHRLVCEIAHGPPPTPDHEAAHICGKGHEGCFGATCLTWKTRLENVADSVAHGTWNHGESVPQHKLTEQQVVEIYRLGPMRHQRGRTAQIADRYGVSTGAIREIWSGKTWAWLTKNGRSA